MKSTKDFVLKCVSPIRSMKISYLPPLMIYFAYGVSGLTSVVQSFFVMRVLGLEAVFLAVLGYWAGIWWAFKMPLGSLVDRFWRFKAAFVVLGAALMAMCLGIMIGLTGHLEMMTKYMSAEWWFVIATLVMPFAYVLQDIVADAMTVEAVPRFKSDGTEVDKETLRIEHNNMQLLGRVAIMSGIFITAGMAGWFAELPAPETGWIMNNIFILAVAGIFFWRIAKIPVSKKIIKEGNTLKDFSLSNACIIDKCIVFGWWLMVLIIGAQLAIRYFHGKFIVDGWLSNVASYEMVYWLSLLIPAVSISGVIVAAVFMRKRKKNLIERGFSQEQAEFMLNPQEKKEGDEKPKVNWWIIGGSAVLLAFLIPLGLLSLTVKQELETIPMVGLKISELPFGLGAWLPAHADDLLFLTSFIIIVLLITKVTRELSKEDRRLLVGTAIIIFIYRATPGPGAGIGYFNMEILKFDEGFYGNLGQMGSALALLGLLFLVPMMIRKSLTWIFMFLILFHTFFLLPDIMLVYGVHNWIAKIFGMDPYRLARTIALIDTAAESPFGQLSMIPMLAWISLKAPPKHKATYFALMASFTNLALSACTLGTKYLNEIFVVINPEYEKINGVLTLVKPGVYDKLGPLVVTVGLIALIAPIAAILFFVRLKKREEPIECWIKNHKPKAYRMIEREMIWFKMTDALGRPMRLAAAFAGRPFVRFARLIWHLVKPVFVFAGKHLAKFARWIWRFVKPALGFAGKCSSKFMRLVWRLMRLAAAFAGRPFVRFARLIWHLVKPVFVFAGKHLAKFARWIWRFVKPALGFAGKPFKICVLGLASGEIGTWFCGQIFYQDYALDWASDKNGGIFYRKSNKNKKVNKTQ